MGGARPADGTHRCGHTAHLDQIPNTRLPHYAFHGAYKITYLDNLVTNIYAFL